MDYLHDLLPEYARQETLVLRVPQGTSLPEGYYAFIETYCTNPDCDCQEVVVQVEEQFLDDVKEFQRSAIPTAVLNYAWNKPISVNNPHIYADAPESSWTQATLQFFREYLETTTEYGEQLNKHYEMIRKEAVNLAPFIRPFRSPVQKENHIGRNDLCHCGSGKKFKKCCGT